LVSLIIQHQMYFEYPLDDKMYKWDEETINWIEIETPKPKPE